MAQILSFLRDDCVFDPEAIGVMSTALEASCIALGVRERNRREREVIATRIIELARRGERNAGRLRDQVLRDVSSSVGFAFAGRNR